MTRLSLVTSCVLLAACGGDDAPADPAGSETSGSTSQMGTTTADVESEAEGSTTAAPSSTSGSPGESSSGPDATSGETSGDASSSGEVAPEVPGGVFLWVGAGGGGPGTDLFPTAVQDIFTAGGVDVELGETLPADFASRFGTLVYLNPMTTFDPDVDVAAAELVEGGGRLVLVMEHCKNGCWGNADGHNALLASLGSSMRMYGDGGADLSETPLAVSPVPPLTDGVGDLVVFYSGRVDIGTATPLGAISGGDVIIGHEVLGWGEVLTVADSSILGYSLGAGQNAEFVANWALH